MKTKKLITLLNQKADTERTEKMMKIVKIVVIEEYSTRNSVINLILANSKDEEDAFLNLKHFIGTIESLDHPAVKLGLAMVDTKDINPISEDCPLGYISEEDADKMGDEIVKIAETFENVDNIEKAVIALNEANVSFLTLLYAVHGWMTTE